MVLPFKVSLYRAHADSSKRSTKDLPRHYEMVIISLYLGHWISHADSSLQLQLFQSTYECYKKGLTLADPTSGALSVCYMCESVRWMHITLGNGKLVGAWQLLSASLPPTFLGGLNECVAYKAAQDKQRHWDIAHARTCSSFLRVPVSRVLCGRAL